jgi:hypothetical protein
MAIAYSAGKPGFTGSGQRNRKENLNEDIRENCLSFLSGFGALPRRHI